MNSIDLKALAKVNLALDVLNKREDGYHEVRMVMQSVHLYDEINLSIRNDDQIKMDSDCPEVPNDERNLAVRAAKLLMEEEGIPQGVDIYLHKYIPVEAGMAGGSADAAAVLFGMNKIFELGLTTEQLKAYGLRLGADVPFCIERGTMLAEGIGEKLSPLPTIPKCGFLIVKPRFSLSTAKIYWGISKIRGWDHKDGSGIGINWEPTPFEDLASSRVIEALYEQDLRKMTNAMGNDLERVSTLLRPEIAKIRNLILNEGAIGAMMSGSGPTVFGIFPTLGRAKRARERLLEFGTNADVYAANAHRIKRIDLAEEAKED